MPALASQPLVFSQPGQTKSKENWDALRLITTEAETTQQKGGYVYASSVNAMKESEESSNAA